MSGNRLRTALRLACAAVVAAGFVALPHTAAEAATVTNSGFETGDTSGWTCTSATVVSSPVHSGSRALSGTPNGQDNARCSQAVSVQPNTAYTLSAFVRGSFVFIGASGFGGPEVSNWTPGATTYTQLSTSFTTGPSATSVTIFVHGWFAQPTYFADDVVLAGPDGPGGGGGPVTEPPGTPSGLTVTGTTSTSVSLSWNAATGTVTGYRVYRDGALADTTTARTITIGGLTPSTRYSFAVSAVNSAGESARSASVSATTSPPSSGGGGALPAHLLTGYWQDFVNGARPLRLRDVPATYDVVAVAFAESTATPGAVTFTVDAGLSSALGGYTEAQFTSDVQALHAQGRKVIISVGGERGTVSVGNSTAATNFANSVFSLMQRFGFDGVDIDLENGINPTFMAQALRSLRSMAGSGLVITMAPQTLDMQSTGMAYFQLALNIRDILTIVHTQYYNSGSMLGCDQAQAYSQGTVNFLTALACIQLENGLRPDQVALGLPASPQAAGGGFQNPANLTSALNCLARGTSCGTFRPPRTYPGIRGAMTWSVNWDASNGFAFANTVAPALDALP